MDISYKTAKGWLTPNEREFLYEMARQVPPNGVICNIGVEYGASVVCLAQGNPTATIAAIDVDLTKYLYSPSDFPNVRLYNGDSAYYNRNWPLAQINFCFVDGDHSYEGVLSDCEYIYLMAGVGSVIAFHDCYSWDHPGERVPHLQVPEVNQAVQKFFRSSRSSGRRFSTWKELEPVDSIRIFQRAEWKRKNNV